MESQSAVSHVTQDTNAKASATTLGRIPVVDPQPHSPCSLTFKAQNSVTDMAETAVVDHGSHNVDKPIKGHFHTQNAERNYGPSEEQGRVLRKGSCNHRRTKDRIS